MLSVIYKVFFNFGLLGKIANSFWLQLRTADVYQKVKIYILLNVGAQLDHLQAVWPKTEKICLSRNIRRSGFKPRIISFPERASRQDYLLVKKTKRKQPLTPKTTSVQYAHIFAKLAMFSKKLVLSARPAQTSGLPRHTQRINISFI